MTREGMLPAAVRENVAWCALVCSSQGVPSTADDRTWATASAPPAFYPDAISLVPGLAADELLQRVGDRRPCAVKDSFADLDLAAAGFDLLFTATWIGTVDALAFPAGVSVRDVTVTRPHLGPDVLVLEVLRAGVVLGGGTGHRHDQVVGLSDVEAADGGDLGAVFSALAVGLRERLGRKPVVGYEQGDSLDAAVAQGFVPLGPLRVWERPALARDQRVGHQGGGQVD